MLGSNRFLIYDVFMKLTAESIFDSVEDAILAIGAGEMVIVTDDEDRENEGDLVMAASKVTPEKVNMMIRHARGLICVPTTDHQLKKLGVHQMSRDNRESHRTDFTVSVDAAEGITTGISAYDRARTIRILSDPKATSEDLVQPGHVFPLRARPGGVLERAGHTEASVDLASLAGLHPSGVICEILNEDGSMARLPELIEFRERFGLKLISIASLIEYRRKRERLVEKVLERPFKSSYGDFKLTVFGSKLDQRLHFALTLGEPASEPFLVRVQSEHILSDVFLGTDWKNHGSMEKALQKIAAEGQGAFVYITQDKRGIKGLLEKTMGEALPEPGGMDVRDYGIGAQILTALGLHKIRLLSSSGVKHVVGLEGYGLEITEQCPL